MNQRFFIRLVAAAAIALGAAPAWAQDTGVYLNILPPGQRGYLSTAEGVTFLNTGVLPPHVDDQREMYGDLVFAPPGLTDQDLLFYFKPAAIEDFPDVVAIEPPMPGVTITRDAFGVPNVKAASRKNLFRGVGYAMAQDRLFAMDLARHAGRGRLSEMVGADPFALEQDEAFYQFAGYSEEDYEAQIDALLHSNSNGRRALLDIDAFVEGVNSFVSLANTLGGRTPVEYIGLDKLPIQPFKRTDVLAVAVTLELLFGAGGGGEHRNAILLEKLQQTYGTTDGAALYDDLREGEDPEAPVTTELSFPFLAQGPVNPAAVAKPDVGSIVSGPMVQITGPVPLVPLALRVSFPRRKGPHPSMSNFLAVTGANAAGGHPIAVMGPQAGYFVPELLTEISMEGAHFKARGVAVTGAPYVVLGRGGNYAWSATAGGSDNTDVRAEKLCEPGGGAPTPSSNHYLFQGTCTPMFERTDTWCAGTTDFCDANPDNVTAVVQRTVHGIVFARATVGGEPVALVKQRASFFLEGQNAAAFLRINRKTDTPRKYARAIGFAPGSFNWLYVNQDDVFYFHSGLFPIRAPGVDYEMPSWGTGEWEWQGFVDNAEHPSELNPAKGWITSWNNKPARDWRAADSNYTFGTVHRVESLDAGLENALMGGSPLTIAQMVEIMEDAGTTDLRGTQVLPLALSIIGSEPALDAVLTILQDWAAAGAPRRDRDDSGLYDHGSAVAIMDAWFERMIHSVFDGQLGAFYSDIPLGFDDKPGAIGSAYQSGYYGLLDKSFRTVLGAPVADPFDVLHCADGTAAGCRTALVQSLSDAVDALTTQFASADPAVWQADPTADQIEFMPFGLAEVDPIPWVNRPTFQQVVQVTSRTAP